MAEVLEFNDMFYTNFDPQMKNHFIMDVDGIPSYMIKTVTLPQIQFEQVVLDHINTKRKLKGKAEWQDVELTLFSPITPSGQQAAMEWIRLSHESLTGRDGYSAMYKKDVDIYLLGPVGDKVSQWKLKGAWISSFGAGDVDWSAGADIVELSITLTYDHAVLEY